jgi:hypothetical protein
MLKILILLFVTALSFMKLKAQITVGMHSSYFSKDAKAASNSGIGISLSFAKFYLDFAGNFASGKGEYLNFSSSYSYPANKISLVVFNVGYAIIIRKVDIIPQLGLGYANEIYQDPVGWNTYYLKRSSAILNAGIIARANVHKNWRIYTGISTFENFKLGIAYSWE